MKHTIVAFNPRTKQWQLFLLEGVYPIRDSWDFIYNYVTHRFLITIELFLREIIGNKTTNHTLPVCLFASEGLHLHSPEWWNQDAKRFLQFEHRYLWRVSYLPSIRHTIHPNTDSGYFPLSKMFTHAHIHTRASIGLLRGYWETVFKLKISKKVSLDVNGWAWMLRVPRWLMCMHMCVMFASRLFWI